MSENQFQAKPIQPEEFQADLGKEYDLLLISPDVIEDDVNLFVARNIDCSECGVSSMFFAGDWATTKRFFLDTGLSQAGIVNEKTVNKDSTGFLVCSDCGSGVGTDVSGYKLRVLPHESWEQYRDYRRGHTEEL